MKPLDVYVFFPVLDKETLFRVTSFNVTGCVQNEDIEITDVDAYNVETNNAVTNEDVFELLRIKLFDDYFDEVCEMANDRQQATAEAFSDSFEEDEL